MARVVFVPLIEQLTQVFVRKASSVLSLFYTSLNIGCSTCSSIAATQVAYMLSEIDFLSRIFQLVLAKEEV
jgi:hypothetical protein